MSARLSSRHSRPADVYSGSASLWRKAYMVDWPLLLLAVVIISIGLVMVASSSLSIGERDYGDPWYFFKRQVLFLGIAAFLTCIVFFINMRYWQRFSGYLMLFALLLMVLVLIPGIGKTVNGSSRWLNFGVFNFQVSEAVKFCTVLYIAGYLVRRRDEVMTTWLGFVKPSAVLSLVALLLLLEPDFGATVVIMVTAMSILFLGGVHFGQFSILITAFVSTMTLLALASPNRMRRIASFMDPWGDPYGSGFQLVQSLIAIGSGGWSGLGLGSSVQKLLYLPEAHTDFLFAIFAEEMGLVGSIVLIVLYGLLVMRVLTVAERARVAGQPFSTYVALGFGLWLAFQSSINIGVNMGVLPTKGLTLPLMSYGGSSLLMSMVVIGITMRISSEASLLAQQAVPRQPSRKRKMH